MPISILKNASVLMRGGKTPFLATGGVAPYTYSVVAGGVGGSINSSTGLYTAPSTKVSGVDTIQAVDASAAIATSTIFVGGLLNIITDIIRTEMSLEQSQIWIYDQKVNVPNDQKIYISVGVLSSRIIGSTTEMNSAGNEVQSVNILSTLIIDLLSRNKSALDQKEQVIMALGSFYSKRIQEANSFSLGRISSSFLNLSELEGSAIPYRFQISVNVTYCEQRTKATSYYDDFSNEFTVTTDP